MSKNRINRDKPVTESVEKPTERIYNKESIEELRAGIDRLEANDCITYGMAENLRKDLNGESRITHKAGQMSNEQVVILFNDFQRLVKTHQLSQKWVNVRLTSKLGMTDGIPSA